ncbi:MAG: hypothetical protein R3Y47_01115 [Lachnospiraceae bacterium]
MYYEKYGNAIIEAGAICGKKIEEIGIDEVHAVSQYTFDRYGNMKDLKMLLFLYRILFK